MSRALSAGRMLRFTPSTPVDEKLVDIVGRSLAAMLGEAQSQPGDEAQRIVVRSAPVHKVGSFRGEGVALARFASSAERTGGKECVSTCSSRWSPFHSKKKQ